MVKKIKLTRSDTRLMLKKEPIRLDNRIMVTPMKPGETRSWNKKLKI